MKYFSIFLLVALVSVQPQVHAQAYKWVDEDGKVYYSDQPPPGQDVEQIEIKTTRSDVDSAQEAKDRSARIKALETERKTREKSRADSATERRERKEQCAAARERNSNLEWMKKIHEVDDQGNRTYLTDDEEEALKQQARDAVQELCD